MAKQQRRADKNRKILAQKNKGGRPRNAYAVPDLRPVADSALPTVTGPALVAWLEPHRPEPDLSEPVTLDLYRRTRLASQPESAKVCAAMIAANSASVPSGPPVRYAGAVGFNSALNPKECFRLLRIIRSRHSVEIGDIAGMIAGGAMIPLNLVQLTLKGALVPQPLASLVATQISGLAQQPIMALRSDAALARWKAERADGLADLDEIQEWLLTLR